MTLKLKQPVIVHTDTGEVPGRIWGRLLDGESFDILPDERQSLKDLLRNVEADRVKAA